jgi:hypothetical protein
MATRFRLTNAATVPDVSPATQTYSHSNGSRKRLETTDASTLTTVAYAPDAADHLIAGDSHHRQFISAPMVAGISFTNGEVIKACVQALMAHANNAQSVQTYVAIVSEDGTTVRRTLLAKGTTTPVLTTSLSSRFISRTQTGATYVTVDGDRILIEFSTTGTPTGAGGVQGHNASYRWGGSGASDLLESNGQTGTTLNPWVEFVPTVTFRTIEDYPYFGDSPITLSLSGSSSKVKNIAGSSTLTMNASSSSSKLKNFSGTSVLTLSSSASTSFGGSSNSYPYSGSVNLLLGTSSNVSRNKATSGTSTLVLSSSSLSVKTKNYVSSNNVVLGLSSTSFKTKNLIGTTSLLLGTNSTSNKTRSFIGTCILSTSSSSTSHKTRSFIGSSSLLYTATSVSSKAKNYTGSSTLSVAASAGLYKTKRTSGVTGVVLSVSASTSFTAGGAGPISYPYSGSTQIAFTVVGLLQRARVYTGEGLVALSCNSSSTKTKSYMTSPSFTLVSTTSFSKAVNPDGLCVNTLSLAATYTFNSFDNLPLVIDPRYVFKGTALPLTFKGSAISHTITGARRSFTFVGGEHDEN